ncbi:MULTISPECIES: 6-phospho-3-hexuloisomerase [Staphylococcus]|uniref:6-phospho-3-hexuloisomerase n=1 Tax=Staphylococcus succinus TaxID=61015 RepID=A0ABX5IP42_9STAP|nr:MULTISPECIES: 6-phospho-3-hexuloisomerase [Staphylococcus]MDH9161108.1 6-phospho-3-hexuloisomerase [Staphylococcus succinus]OIJ31493.1 6-phospho 3-hexuloisomerase [Staphylococcus sp. LCT-H4]PNZ18379.1 6-phospho-3-hexuloisomerase [Staphylococcus succinus subsp. succinus]PTI68438.1 6-phospho-3-hexuloisomerase [Staphylococcus succinus]RIN30137.1 6-phospho-3-hexuloisomerase [Staphylococcus succinus]
MNTIEIILNEIQEVMHLVDEQEIDDVATVLTKDKRIFVVGAGRSGFQGKGFAMRLMHIGYQSYVVGETITPSVQKDDVWVAISGSGTTESIVTQTEKVKKLGVHVIALTSDANSKLAQVADKSIIVPGATKMNTGVESTQLLSSLFDQTVHISLDVLNQKLAERDNTSNQSANAQHTNVE